MTNTRILVVEDEAIVARDIAHSLKQLGYDVPALVYSGEEAVEQATKMGPDLVLMDIKLRGKIDGVTAAEQIQARFDIPVVYLTAYADKEILQRVKFTEPFGFVLKPFEVSELDSTIEIALSRHEMEKRLKESEARYRAVIEDQTELICRFQPDGTLTFVNGAYCRYFDKAYNELVGSSFKLLVPDEEREAREKRLTSLCQKSPVATFEQRVIMPTGEIRWQQWTDRALFDAEGHLVEFQSVGRDITERKRMEEALKQQNRELALLNQANQGFSSTLDLDRILAIVLEEVRHLLDVVACSVWLVDPETITAEGGAGELVCRQAIGPHSEIVRGWRLAPGKGLAGWVVQNGECLIVPDTRTDERHFKDVDKQIGVELRSLVSVPLQVKQKVIGALHVLDTKVDRFRPTNLTLLKSLAATAAIAIENAQLYAQARQDAKTKARLLDEVNHRVKNTLTSIVGMLYAERRYAREEAQGMCQAIITDLISRIEGLTTVHSLLSTSEWSPLPLSELAAHIIRAAMQILPADKQVVANLPPSPIRVMPKQATSLAIVINELVTNTFKYALPMLTEGRPIQITVRIKRQDGLVLFEFRDNGPGYPEEVLRLERHNVGMYLVQNIVRSDLQGELTLKNDQGAVTVISFRAIE